MSSVYAISFTDNTIPGKTTFTIAPSQSDGPNQLTVIPPHPEKAHTTLTLFGQGALKYGQMINENFVHLLENFASDGTPPVLPTVGQTWYDASTSTLKVYGVTGEWTAAPGNQPASNFGVLLAVTASDEFTIAGDHAGLFTPGLAFTISNDTVQPDNNSPVNAPYVTVSAVYDVPPTDETRITVQAYTIVGVITGPGGTWTVLGNHASIFPNGRQFTVRNNAFGSANIVYTVASSSNVGPNTNVIVTGTIPVGATVSGFISGVPVAQGSASGLIQISAQPAAPVPGQIWFNYGPPATVQIFDGVNFTNYTLLTSPSNIDLDMQSHLIHNLSNPVVATDALNLGYADARYLKLDASNDPLTGSLDMGNFKITSLGNATVSTDALNLGTGDGRYLKLDGSNSPMTGILNMGVHRITNVVDPSAAQDAATQAYVLAQIAANNVNPATPFARIFTGAGAPSADLGQKAGDIYIRSNGQIWIAVTTGAAAFRQVYPAVYS